jgi:type I restriction enzyme S subunit
VVVIRGTDFKDLKSGSLVRSPIRFIKKPSLIKRQLQVGDIIVENSVNAKSRCIGSTLLITDEILKRLGNNAICVSFCKLYRPYNRKLSTLTHLHMKNLYDTGRMHFYNNIATNGIGNFQSTRFLEMESLFLPKDKDLLFALAEKLTVLTTTVYSGKIENLRQTRDLLLPKLISGKIDVSDLDIEIGET